MRRDIAPYLKDLNPRKRILEVGPVNKPILTKEEANVFYVDVQPEEDSGRMFILTSGPHDPAPVPLDYILRGTYAETFAQEEPFDALVLSHVLEHVPRLVDFFQDIVRILTPRGKVYTFMPDHRYCFDHFRQPTSFAEVWHIHTSGMAFPLWRLADFHMEKADVNSPKFYWEGRLTTAANLFANPKNLDQALHACEAERDAPSPSTHVSVFTPESFLLLLYNLTRAAVFPFRLKAFHPTPPNDLTFGVVLEAAPWLPQDRQQSQQEANRLLALLEQRMAEA